MKLNELSAPIRQTATRGGGFGSDVESALFALADAFDSNPEATLQDLAKALKPKAKKAPAKPAKSKTFDDPPTSEVVAEALKQLAEVPTYERGKALVEEMRVLKKPYTAPLAKEIAGRMLGARLAFKNRDEAFDAIKELFGRREWDKGGVEIIGRQTSSFATK